MPSSPPRSTRTRVPRPRRAAGRRPQPLLGAVLHLDQPGYDAVALSTRTAGGWRPLTYAGLRRRSAGLAQHLRDQGARAGDRVAILAEPGDAWVTAFFGVLRAGAVVVPLDRSLTTDELRAVLADSGAVAVLASTAHLPQAGSLRDDVASVRHVLHLHERSLLAFETHSEGPVPGDFLRRDDDSAVVVYTSGTTGSPKGVVLTYANLLRQVRGLLASQRLGADNVFLSLLPLSHMLELTCGLLAPLAMGARVCYSATLYPHEIGELLREQRVTRMIVVPVFLRLLKKSIEGQVRTQHPLVRSAFALQHLAAGVVPDVRARRALFTPVHARLGGRLTAFYCGGAPLDDDVAEFFERMGIEVFQGYGLTETSPVVAMNAPGAKRRGSVGRPLPGVSVRIGDGELGQPGEVLVKGSCVMAGYLHDEVRTREVLDEDGTLHTGDLGRLDGDGYLYITGRAKNLIVMDNGKNVQPEEVEHAIEPSDLVADVCVMPRRGTRRQRSGYRRERVCAVVVPSDEARRRYPDRLELQNVVEAEVSLRVARLAAFKRPSSVVLHDGELPKTTTRKVLRAQVAAWLAGQEGADR